jgi:RNase P/RNase MRP subunit p30
MDNQSKYVLISFYEKSGGLWVAYGWINAGHNERIAVVGNFYEVIDFCFQYGVPVVETANATHIVEKLQG